MNHYDLLVIGAGSGGVRASRIAAGLGARVAVAEERALGGTCVNLGCVPKKLFVYGSQFSEQFAHAAGYGWQLEGASFDWAQLRDNKTREIERLNGVYDRLLTDAGVELLRGHARILGPQEVEVGDKRYRADKILIAVGGWPFVPDFPGREHVISSNEVFYLDELPRAMVIVGGGYIACEFASIFNGLGVQTHLLYRRDLFLRGFDKDVRELMAQQMAAKGVHLHFNTDVERVERQADAELAVHTDTGETLRVGQVMYATGRKPLLDNLGLENTRVELNKQGAIEVDDDFRTAEPSIYAIGDAVGRKELTPVALAEGMVLARRLYGADQFREGELAVNYQNIPTAVFTQPNIATVGLSEEEAGKEGWDVNVYKAQFTPLPLTLTDSDEKVMVKLIVDKASDRVLGCHMVGQDAGEIIQGLAVAMTAGATKADFDRTIGIHPTVAEEFVTLRTPVTSAGSS
ncbi:glutathione-disulfide reductase [Gilvimarinus algae]|uniref:Glutathione-disulfide reductase n=1 Tax=Gilvimarinus algae TaxID=3058037 RepID=A0ABT8TD68_9GAMM|nr:glutathione-disulfide reductase [Gilvimarinus sp. SDUM040014]MDO3382072.1 glutathione-disulfide reductase [Gilvimarinus sp. SDUM040014]